MKSLLDIRRFKLYAWIGLGFWLLGVLSNLAQYPDEAGGRSLNDLWRMPYVTILNYILFEYTIPRLSWKRFDRSFLLILGQFCVYSVGLHIWGLFGIARGF